MIFVFGLASNIAMLLRKQWGVYLAIVNILVTLGSTGTGIWQAIIKMNQIQPAGPAMAGFIIGLVFTLLIRFGLIVAYAVAVYQFFQSCQRALAGRQPGIRG